MDVLAMSRTALPSESNRAATTADYGCLNGSPASRQHKSHQGQLGMDPTLNELEERLQASRFFRISRAAIINLNAVGEVYRLPGGSGEVLMKNGQRLEVSRRRFRELFEALEN
jgi:DNA-binding LytR/AlgR family response regulator